MGDPDKSHTRPRLCGIEKFGQPVCVQWDSRDAFLPTMGKVPTWRTTFRRPRRNVFCRVTPQFVTVRMAGSRLVSWYGGCIFADNLSQITYTRRNARFSCRVERKRCAFHTLESGNFSRNSGE